MRDSVSIEYTLSADLPLGFLHGGGGGAHKKATKCTAQKEKNCVRNALVNASTRTFMDIFAAILTALDIADIRIFVVKYYWKQKALQISDDVRESFRVRLSFRINAEAFFWVCGLFCVSGFRLRLKNLSSSFASSLEACSSKTCFRAKNEKSAFLLACSSSWETLLV